MKKLLSVLTLAVTLVLGLGLTNLYAEEGIVEVYPYDNEACSLETADCKDTKVGRSNWTLTYNGFRYHFVRGSARYGHELIDANADGFIDATESGAVTYNAFGMLWMNNTDTTIKLKNTDRTLLTGVQHRIWAYFDETGELQMIENQIHQYYIIDDNYGVEGADPDWRLATELEIDAYVAAETKPADMRYAHLRMKRVETSVDPDGYVLEPLTYIKWTNADWIPAAGEEPEVGQDSTILDYDPNEVHIPSGWNVMTFSTNDRGSYEPALAMVTSLPAAFIDEAVGPAIIEYNEVPATHTGFAVLDKNPYVDGVQIVANFGEPFTLDMSGLSATWTDMFDEEDKIIHAINQKIPFDVIISEDGEVIETINFTVVGDAFVPSGPITKVSTDEFEKVYDIQMKSTTPEGQVRTSNGIIVVGVLPNRFEGVENKFYRDGEFIDLLAGIEAFNGNGVDITDAIQVSWGAGFNPYNPQPGNFTITLDVAYEHHWDPVLTNDDKSIGYNDVTPEDSVPGFKVIFWNETDPENPVIRYENNIIRYYPNELAKHRYNVPFLREAYVGQMTLIDFDHKELVAETTGLGWGSVVGVVDAEGYLKHTWNGFASYVETLPDGTTKPHADAGAMMTAVRAYELQEGEIMLLAHGGAEGSGIRYGYGDRIEILGRPDVYYTAEAQVTYNITVDDRTAPQIRVNNPNYKVDGSMFDTPEEAILANVSAFDNFSETILVVVDDGGLTDLSVPGVYTVSVDAEDQAANFSSVTFDVTVVAPKLTEAEVDTLLDEQRTALQAVIDQQKADLQALMDQQRDDLQDIIDAQEALITAQEAALAALETQVTDDGATKAELADALAKAQEALAAAQAAQNTADTATTDIEAKPEGTPIWLTIVISLVAAGVAFGAAFLVLGKKK
ncbi:MAG: hypothetical protein PHD47_01605 [Acholeplasmataceae bacterium]|nr:hypothetical protein [Acholeplasmataceae bacterium]